MIHNQPIKPHNCISGDSRWNRLGKTLGPGLIFAGASIGVSHLVQSTRAGALYGFTLAGIIVLTFIIKFPFFEFGPRYVAAMQENLLEGYRRLGNWAFALFMVLSFLTMFSVQAAVTMVTAGLFVNILPWSISLAMMSAVILAVCGVMLIVGKYALLDKTMKVMILLLGVSTLTAFIAAAFYGDVSPSKMTKSFEWELAGVTFLLALLGWMPSPIDISVWQSFWCVERSRQVGYAPTMREALIDFHLGYWGTAVMALLFLGLGALVMFGRGEMFADPAVRFTGQVISLYTKSLGQWSYPIIATAAAVTMFSTTLSCLDAYSRIIKEGSRAVFHEREQIAEWVYRVTVVLLIVSSVVIIGVFMHRMKALVDVATIISFLAAPVFGFMNLKVVTGKHMPAGTVPSHWYQAYAWGGLIILSGFSLYYLFWRLTA